MKDTTVVATTAVVIFIPFVLFLLLILWGFAIMVFLFTWAIAWVLHRI